MKQLIVVGILALGALFYTSVYIIYEGQQAVLVEFGKPVGQINESGLHFKMPWTNVRRIDFRILNWDGDPNEIPTRDKKYIQVDTTARWQITEPLTFIQTLQNEAGARQRLDAILDGFTRDVISSHNLVEVVRNSNIILDRVAQRKKDMAERLKSGKPGVVEEEETVGEIETIFVGREKLSTMIIDKAQGELKSLGIALIDVQIRRIAYNARVQEKVYLRMISERQRVAEKILSFGKGEQAKIEGKTDKDLKAIQSEAYKIVQGLKGTAEAKATKIYAEAMGRDPSFFAFLRKLEAYENGIGENSQFLLSSQSNFWNVFKKGWVK